MRGTIDYSKRLDIQFAMFNITTPYPGTELYERAFRDHMLRHQEWSAYDLSHPVLELPDVPSETVQAYYYRAYREFYLRPSYMLKRILAIRTWYEFSTYSRVFLGMLSGMFHPSPRAVSK